jgi:hypothetical protein
MSDINLLSSDSTGASSVNNGLLSRILARLILILLIAAVGIYVLLFIVNYTSNNSLKTTQQKIDTLQAQALASKDRNELVTRQEQISQLDNLIDQHSYWSYLLPELARVSLKSAKYTDISATSDGTLKLSIVLPSYADIEKYMQIFDLPEYNQQFSNVRIVGIDSVQNESSIETKLRLQLTFNPSFIKGRL